MKFELSSGKTVRVYITHLQSRPLAAANYSYGPATERALHQLKVWQALGGTPGTFAAVVDQQGREFTGAAKLATVDQFNKHKGTSIAVRRALAKTDLTKSERRELWGKLFTGKYESSRNPQECV